MFRPIMITALQLDKHKKSEEVTQKNSTGISFNIDNSEIASIGLLLQVCLFEKHFSG